MDAISSTLGAIDLNFPDEASMAESRIFQLQLQVQKLQDKILRLNFEKARARLQQAQKKTSSGFTLQDENGVSGEEAEGDEGDEPALWAAPKPIRPSPPQQALPLPAIPRIIAKHLEVESSDDEPDSDSDADEEDTDGSEEEGDALEVDGEGDEDEGDSDEAICKL